MEYVGDSYISRLPSENRSLLLVDRKGLLTIEKKISLLKGCAISSFVSIIVAFIAVLLEY